MSVLKASVSVLKLPKIFHKVSMSVHKVSLSIQRVPLSVHNVYSGVQVMSQIVHNIPSVRRSSSPDMNYTGGEEVVAVKGYLIILVLIAARIKVHHIKQNCIIKQLLYV